MPEFLIESIDDPRLDPYRDLKQSAARPRDTFVAEGEKLVLRLIESSCRVESILCTRAAHDRIRVRIPIDVPVYLATTPLISTLIGFRFHRGVLASGRRPNGRTVESLCLSEATSARDLVILCPEIRDPENLGSIIRTAAAFGASGLVAGCAGTDPFSRRVLRTSMGAVLRLPIVQTDDWNHILQTLERAGFETIAAVLDPAAEELATAAKPSRAALVFGNEAAGLPDRIVEICRWRVTLPMAKGVDSLNVAVAAGIVINHFAS